MRNQGSFTIVTGASENHFHCLQNLLFTVRAFEPEARTIVYDLGLSRSAVKQLRDASIEYRRFDFDRYPAHVNIQVNRGEYAWKPIIVHRTLHEFGGMIVWLDAGNLVRAPLARLRNVLATNGIYTPTSPDLVRTWTHPQTLKYLKASSAIRSKPNRNGAVVGLAADVPGIIELAERWKTCALDKHCIAPPGSNRTNHRHDQSVLTVLAYQFQSAYGCLLEDALLDISIHKDSVTAQQVREQVGSRLHREQRSPF